MRKMPLHPRCVGTRGSCAGRGFVGGELRGGIHLLVEILKPGSLEGWAGMLGLTGTRCGPLICSGE